MKVKNIIIAAALMAPLGLNAQQALNIVKGGTAYNFEATPDLIEFSNGGQNVSIAGVTFNLAEVTRMEVTDQVVDDNTVEITYSGATASVVMAGNISDYVTATIKGAHVTIDQSSDVADDTCGEITYVLSGESADGSFTQNGSYKSTIELQGLTLTNPSGAAIDIENGKRIELSAKNGTVNTLADGAAGDQKGAIYCKGHLEFKGKGTLNVTGNKSHAINTKEYIEMKNLTLNILGSVKDGINCAQYFLMESGTLTITNPGEDGIQAAYKDSKNREDEDTGCITIKGGKLVIDQITGSAAKGLKPDADFIMSGGEVTITTSAPGEWDSSKSKTKASACISTDGNVEISGGTLTLRASGGGGKGISCGGDFNFTKAELNVVTSGGVLAYNGSTLSQNYTGNTDRLDSDWKSSPKGVKADGTININGGTLSITTSGNGGEGLESKAELYINDGNVKVRAKDDAINSAADLYIKGGVVDVISTDNDGIDSNGNLYIQGGVVMAFGGAAPECGLDADSPYAIYFTGGYILAAGGSSTVPSKTGSTQPFVSVNAKVSANTQVSIANGSDTLYTFTTPEDLTDVSLGGSTGGWRPGGNGGMGQGNSSLMISTPDLKTGTTYTVTSGTTSVNGQAQLTGTNRF